MRCFDIEISFVARFLTNFAVLCKITNFIMHCIVMHYNICIIIIMSYIFYVFYIYRYEIFKYEKENLML